jgi:hypothetical protein
LDFAEQTLNRAMPHALILVDDDCHPFALGYARYALGQRPDVAVINVNLLGYPWYQASLAKAHPDLILASQAGDLLRLNADLHPAYSVGATLTLSGIRQ